MRTFDQWKYRPVYMVQCFTVWVYRNHFAPGSIRHRLRVLREYRTEQDQADRDQTAQLLRQGRRCGVGREDVRKQHEKTLADSRGVAVRVDIDQELERMGERFCT